ncbi:restriction endonuclease subunit S [Cytobacillus sp. Hm23]
MKTIKLGEIVKVRTGKLDANANNENGKYPFFTCSKYSLRIDNYSYDCECVLVAGNGDLNVKYYKGKFDAYQRTYIVEARNTTILNVKYLYYFLESYLKKLREQSIGGVIKYIKLSNLTDALIPLPDIKIQKKIVGVLSKAQSLIDNRKAQITALSDLTQSIFYEMFGDPVTNNHKWNANPLGDFLDRIDSGWSPKSESFPAKEGEEGVLKLSAVTKGVYNHIENKALFVDTPFKSKYEVKKGDLLITRKNTRELVGACAYVFETPTNLMMPDTVFRLVFKSPQDIDPIYLWVLFNNSSFKKKVTSLAEGSSGSMPNISKKNLMKIGIVVPPLELQNKFSKVIVGIEECKDKFNRGLTLLEDNYLSLMQRAFKGELFTIN